MPPPCTCRNGLTCVPCYQALLATSARTGVTLPACLISPLTLPPAETSTQLQARMQEVARRLGGWQRFTVRRSDKAMVVAGFPDDLYLGHGRQLVIEYKNEGEHVTMKQQAWLEAFWVNNPHSEVYAAWPSDEAAVVACLRGPAPQLRDRQWMTRLPLPCTCEEVL